MKTRSTGNGIIILILFCLSFGTKAQVIHPKYSGFPDPPPNENMLFYLQRTIDNNTVVYEINYTTDGKINAKKPVKVYWIDFDNGGIISPLTFAQSMFAYGVESKMLDEKIFMINLVSYKKLKFYLKPTGKNKNYETHVVLNNKPSILTKIFVTIIGGTYLKPIVLHIELVGKDIVTGERITEKIKPDEK